MRDRIRVRGTIKAVQLIERSEGGTLATVLRRQRGNSFDQGVEEGRRLGIEEAAGRLDDAALKLGEESEAATGELTKSAIQLALAISSAILKKELAAGNYDIEAMVRETLQDAGVGRNACEVHLHPADYSRLADTKFRSGTRLFADEGVPLGDVQVETALGLLVRDTLGSLAAIEQRLSEDLT